MRLSLLQILEDRFAKGATIVTSKLPVNQWYEYINEPTLADAICDRLKDDAHKIELKGDSLRTKKTTKFIEVQYLPSGGKLCAEMLVNFE
jgi:DNA replication protein DnaC